MRLRVPVGPYGPPAQTPDGMNWAMLPDDLWGELGKAVQIALRALMSVWNGLTMTEITREELRERINELREKKGRKPITNKRTISWYFSQLIEHKVIERGRVEEKKNDWYTKLTIPLRGKTDDKPPVQVGKPVPSGPPKLPPDAPQVIDLSYGPWAMEQLRKHGWLLIVNEQGELDRTPIEGVDQVELPGNTKHGLKLHRASILAYLKDPPQLE